MPLKPVDKTVAAAKPYAPATSNEFRVTRGKSAGSKLSSSKPLPKTSKPTPYEFVASTRFSVKRNPSKRPVESVASPEFAQT